MCMVRQRALFAARRIQVAASVAGWGERRLPMHRGEGARQGRKEGRGPGWPRGT